MLEERKTPIGINNADVRAFAEQMLIDRIFMGDYQEKRYVTKLNAYKDLIVLNKHEKILCDDLANVKNRMLSENANAWFGFTDPTDVGAPAVYCIWTTLDDSNRVQGPGTSPNTTSVGFGEYWFQIKAIRFGMHASAMELHVSVLRPIDPTSSMSSGPTISSIAQQALEVDTTKIQQYVQENIIEVDWIRLMKQWKTSINQMAYRFFATEITWTNLVQFIRILGLFTIALFKWSVNFVHTLGEFTLRLVFELNRLIKTATPIILAIVSLMNKMIGGLYILLAMIWGDLFYGENRHRKTPPVPDKPSNRAPIAYRENIPRTFPQSNTYNRPPTTSSRFHSNT